MRAGVLETYLLDSYSARRLGLRPTGHAARATGDAPGVAPIFASLTVPGGAAYARKMAIKSTFVAALILFFFAFAGTWLLQALGISQLQIGPQIDPGVPWCLARGSALPNGLHLALKSGNFGSDDFFIKAFDMLAAGA